MNAELPAQNKDSASPRSIWASERERDYNALASQQVCPQLRAETSHKTNQTGKKKKKPEQQIDNQSS